MGRMTYQHYNPPINFGHVEEDLYRSGEPNELNFPFMEKLGLKCVIWLAGEEPNQGFLDFIDDQEIDFHHLGVMESNNASDPMTEDTILEALELILHNKNHPMAIMCSFGRHRTGKQTSCTVVGCLRKLQGWNLASIFEEYQRFAAPKVRIHNEQFIELFDTDLVTIPNDYHPKWLYRQAAAVAASIAGPSAAQNVDASTNEAPNGQQTDRPS
ncbi:tyrosine-protein phosphatase required for protection against superoxide stress (By similarity) [Mycoemilia scoparia]|uniref:Putative tyrosine-protein phosphatase OCA1 n=1 Tax=Mycoemilia scoparia TaxID=417184 RepID=A0A9W7ZRE4_9FUNG|nr:tyrosine-protein phosphatase required for protection against superoxide stress (By similarity) [Mycoemilia scoparia]